MKLSSSLRTVWQRQEALGYAIWDEILHKLWYSLPIGYLVKRKRACGIERNYERNWINQSFTDRKARQKYWVSIEKTVMLRAKKVDRQGDWSPSRALYFMEPTKVPLPNWKKLRRESQLSPTGSGHDPHSPSSATTNISVKSLQILLVYPNNYLSWWVRTVNTG